MNYEFLKEVVNLMEEFEKRGVDGNGRPRAEEFKKWLAGKLEAEDSLEPEWEGKVSGRSADSIIATLLVHMNHYARNYFRAAIYNSDFATPEEVIFLIVLRFSGPVTKMDLIKKNVYDKPAGMQIINRLISKGWIAQQNSEVDRRSKMISATATGLDALDELMAKVRQATSIVTGPLTQNEKFTLISLLNKLNDFHLPIYHRNYDSAELLQKVTEEIHSRKN